jgi:hypothetical protein
MPDVPAVAAANADLDYLSLLVWGNSFQLPEVTLTVTERQFGIIAPEKTPAGGAPERIDSGWCGGRSDGRLRQRGKRISKLDGDPMLGDVPPRQRSAIWCSQQWEENRVNETSWLLEGMILPKRRPP